jgi:hypothetical protein
MRLQIDTVLKTIKLENNIKISELIENLKTLLPNDWMDFTLETNVTIGWTNPIYIRDYPYWGDYPWYKTTSPHYGETTSGEMYKSYGDQCQLNAGSYNVEM